ncbi:MAG TPA: cytochrome P450 [Pseudonocardiaceae bacterium]|nr:cytochrome P450 [Pseudonocardiaceae bacterium]
MNDPYTAVARLRAEAPVARVVVPPGMPAWLVTRYADVRAAMADPRLGKDSRRMMELFSHVLPADRREDGDGGQLMAHMLNSDPPDHERLRRLVNKAFTARRIEQLRPRIQQIADELLAAIDQPEVDLLDAFAFPLPITVICELLGVPTDDRDDFRKWSNLLLSDADDVEEQAAAVAMTNYLVGLIAAKREHPGDDMLSALVQARDEGDALSELELVSTAFLLMVAGHETTVNLIGNGTLALINHPDQMAALRADPSLLPGAIEEFLRYQGPLNHATFRFTLEPTEIGGVAIPAGEFVMVSLLSANRDPDRFPDPDELDIRRDTQGHMAFGHGIHYCLGAPLARLEAGIAFRGLLDRFGSIDLAVPAAELVWRPGTLIRGLERLPVRLGANE